MFRLCYFLSVFIFLSLFFFNSAWAGSTFDSQDLIIEHKDYKESFKGLDLHRYLFGVLPVLRYNFTILQKAVPFLNIGAGIAYTNIDEPDLSTHYQFNSQAGCGIHYFLRSDFALTWQYRLLHVSNAGIEEPNDGINAHLVLFGFNWFC